MSSKPPARRSIFRARPSFAELQRRTAGWRRLSVWLPVVFALAVIAAESTDTFSSDHTSGWIRPWVERLFGHINDTLWAFVHHLARKSGHFCGYGLVCLTLLRAWLYTLAGRTAWSLRAWRLRASVLAILTTAVVASLDEWHQTTIPSRTGTPWDVLLDSCGATILCAVVWLLFRWWRNAPDAA